ncbi:uncharacterized protein LOC127835073 [Dreissena polymorpha]|nr:uncharacterized protein LOC127835073 [Dreissena polymorpha]
MAEGHDQQILVDRHVVKKVYFDNIMDSLKEISNNSDEILAKTLKYGYEGDHEIRLMILGMFGAGKTSLVNNLINNFRNENIIPLSTEGFDLHRCKLIDNGDWCLDKELKYLKYHNRYRTALKETKIIGKMYSTSREASEPGILNFDLEQPSISLEEVLHNVKEQRDDEGIKDIIKVVQKLPEMYEDVPVNIPAPVIKKDITVSVWDFAGQTLYYSTHQFFLNKSSIYLVLMDLTKSLDDPVREGDKACGILCGLMKDCTYLDVFKFWLNAIHMYSGDGSSVGKLQPSIILVGTRKDEMTGTNDEKEIKNDLYFEKALQRAFVKGSPILKHIHPRKFLVNNLSPADPVFNQLKTEILCLAENQEYWGKKRPIRWILLEQSLDKLRDEGRQLLQMVDIQNANESNVHPLGEDELQLFLEIQHRHGNILYFNTDQLKGLIILDPQWIIQAFQCLITHVKNKNPSNFDAWEDYTNLAILKPEVFNEIMDKSAKTIGDNRVYVIKYMEHLDVMVKPFTFEEAKEARNMAADLQIEEDKHDAGQQLNTKYLDFHIVPCRLKKPPPFISDLTSPKAKKTTQVLCFVFSENFMPQSFYHRLVALCIRTWPISQEGDETLLYNGVAVFDIQSHSAYTLTIWYQDHIIYVRLSSWSKKYTEDIDFQLCKDVRHTLRMCLLNCVGQSVDNPRTATAFEEYIQCPFMQEFLHNKGMLRVADFMYDNELICKACRPRHTVERAEALQYWYKHTLDLIDSDDDDRPAEDSDLWSAASSIGNEYWMLGIELGLTDARMNTLYFECGQNNRLFSYKCMAEWRRKESEKATIRRLNRAINAAKLYCKK